MMVHKLSSTFNTLLHHDALCIVYFSDFHSITKYEIIFWGNLSNKSFVYKRKH